MFTFSMCLCFPIIFLGNILEIMDKQMLFCLFLFNLVLLLKHCVIILSYRECQRYARTMAALLNELYANKKMKTPTFVKYAIIKSLAIQTNFTHELSINPLERNNRPFNKKVLHYFLPVRHYLNNKQ